MDIENYRKWLKAELTETFETLERRASEVPEGEGKVVCSFLMGQIATLSAAIDQLRVEFP